ncbi:30S ribosomal protein S9 [Candidatus Parcubacteria bacterium]|nr:30S ribosomal protein S9 [Candidatus Parcubacteria bacterium]
MATPRKKVASRPKKKAAPTPPAITETSPPGRYVEAVGRRKTSVARIRLYDGAPFAFTINGRPVEAYFREPHLITLAESPMKALALTPVFAVKVNVSGGGVAGQAEAVRHGLSRALVKWEASHRPRLKKLGFLRRDPRMKERKKYGLKGARRAPQWQKR